MKYKTSELEGKPLDAAVAIAEVVAVEDINAGLMRWNRPDGVWRGWNPSTDWRDGGPIIERERIELLVLGPSEWQAGYDYDGHDGSFVGSWAFGPTPLVAAMRAYVAKKLGEEVELP